jgi:hypothetical protein
VYERMAFVGHSKSVKKEDGKTEDNGMEVAEEDRRQLSGGGGEREDRRERGYGMKKWGLSTLLATKPTFLGCLVLCLQVDESFKILLRSSSKLLSANINIF